FLLDVSGQRLLDELGPNSFEIEAVGKIIEDSLYLHVVGLDQARDDLLFRHCHYTMLPIRTSSLTCSAQAASVPLRFAGPFCHFGTVYQLRDQETTGRDADRVGATPPWP